MGLPFHSKPEICDSTVSGNVKVLQNRLPEEIVPGQQVGRDNVGIAGDVAHLDLKQLHVS